MIKVVNVDEEGRFGGPERRISLVAAKLKAMGVTTTVIIPKLNSTYFQRYLSERDIDFLVLDITRLSLEPKILVRFVLRFPFEILLLFRVMRKQQPDVVHVNGASQFKVALAAKLAGQSVVWHLNNTFLKRPVKIAFDLCSRFCVEGVIYAGSRAGSFYRVKERFGNLPLANIEASVSEEFFSIPIKESLSRRLEIVCIGGVSEAKGIDDAVLCAAELRRRDILFRIRVAGNILASQKAYMEAVHRLIEAQSVPVEYFEFLGEVADIPSLLADADIAMTLSHREASPMAVWEGMAAGRIVLATDVGSVPDHIVHGKNGFVVVPKDVDSVVAIIEGIVHNEIGLNGIRESARATAEKRFTAKVIAEQHKRIYNQVISNK